MTRTDVTFTSGDDTCAAWLYRPGGGSGRSTTTPRPIIVMAHGLGAVKEMRLDAFAERFQAAGYACLVFDYRHFGASSGEPRQLLDIHRQLQDWRAAVAYARTLDDVDPDRVVVWGTSFSGGHVIVTAAQDHRIAAAVAQCPFTDGLASSMAVPPRTSIKLTLLAIRDAIGAALGRDPIRVPAYGPPGSTALMTAPDCEPGSRALIPNDLQVPKDIAARFTLQLIRHFPGRDARKVRCPIFFAICENDTVAPARRTQKYAAQAPLREVKLYDSGHFDIYIGAEFERTIADEIAFLTRRVPVTA